MCKFTFSSPSVLVDGTHANTRHCSINCSKTVIGLSGGLTQAWSIAIGKAAPGSSIPATYAAAIVSDVSDLWRSDIGGATSFMQLNNVKTSFNLSSGMVLPDGPGDLQAVSHR
jgi:xyloglucan-specific exo-beta-1,4-glucanase